MMELNMTEKQFRRLLDLVYIGNWVLNSTRGDDRINCLLYTSDAADEL